MQMIFQAINLAGNIAGQATGFSNAQIFDPSFQTQSIVLETFLSLIALVIVFATDLHHLMLSAIIESYRVFPFVVVFCYHATPTLQAVEALIQSIGQTRES